MSQERPILFNAVNIRRILAGEKTQTRRVVKYQPTTGRLEMPRAFEGVPARADLVDKWGHRTVGFPCPFGSPGDRLWVREAWAAGPGYDDLPPREIPPPNLVRALLWYRTCDNRMMTDIRPRGRWRAAIHMPRWASRITLEVTQVRVERIQDMVGIDAVAEGIPLDFPGGHHGAYKRARQVFSESWDVLHEKRGWGWERNPWVWAITFRKINPTEAA